MKSTAFYLKALALFIGVFMTAFGLFGAVSAFAEEGESESSVYTETEIDTPVDTQPETEAPIYTEPETEEPIYTEPETEEPEYTEEQETEEPVYTEPETEEETEYIGGNVEPYQEPATYFEPPTDPKTVSEKTYSTNYTAGIVSWICVAVGLIVVISVVISTMASGRKYDRARL